MFQVNKQHCFIVEIKKLCSFKKKKMKKVSQKGLKWHESEEIMIFFFCDLFSLGSCSLPSLFLTVPRCANGIIDKTEWPRCLCSFARHYVCFNHSFNWQWNGDEWQWKDRKELQCCFACLNLSPRDRLWTEWRCLSATRLGKDLATCTGVWK